MRKNQGHRRFLVGALLVLLLSNVSFYCQTPANHSPATDRVLPLRPYYALVIGNNHYSHVNGLKTPINDVTALKKLPENKYGFQVKPLTDATREEIFASLQDYENQLPENSNLLIYYAGHGYHDRDTDVAYWLPVDAESNNRSNWISASD